MWQRLLFVVFLIAAAPMALAQDAGTGGSRYQGWSAGGGDLRDLIGRLNGLIDEAERARAADPRFLSDIRDLIARYDRPWRARELSDEFRDGDFERNPAWSVAAGEYWVESGYGLRSIVKASATAPSEQRAAETDPAAAILGAILGQVLRDKSAGGTASPERATRAVIHTSAGITNAFALSFDFWVSESTGGLEVGVFQGRYDGPGYRLRINPSARPAAELSRASARGSGVIDSYSRALELKDGKPHRVDGTRNGDGRMAVSVDGNPVMKGTDRSFRDPWDGVVLVNHGGDFTVRRITVDGTH